MEYEKKRSESSLFLTFRVKGQLYGVSVHTVIEINREFNITPIPQTPDYVLGFINLRGKVIPIVDLRQRFGLGMSTREKESCVLVVRGPSGPLGVWVDTVCEVADVPGDRIEGAPALGTGDGTVFVTGMAHIREEVAILLDLAQVLNKDVEIVLPEPEEPAA